MSIYRYKAVFCQGGVRHQTSGVNCRRFQGRLENFFQIEAVEGALREAFALDFQQFYQFAGGE